MAAWKAGLGPETSTEVVDAHPGEPAQAVGEAACTAVLHPAGHGHEDRPWDVAFALVAPASAYARRVERAKSMNGGRG